MTKIFRADYWDERVQQKIKRLISDPDNLEAGFSSYIETRGQSVEPLEDRIAIIDELIENKSAELSRLIDLYLAGSFDKDLLQDRKQSLEETLARLRDERASVQRQVGQFAGPEQIAELKKFIQQITLRLPNADHDFALRERLLDSLGVRTILAIEDGQEVVYLHCEFGLEERLAHNSDTTQTTSRRRESALPASFRAEEEGSCRSIGKHSMGYKRN